MPNLNWQKIETIVDEALELPKSEQAAFIESRCGDNIQLKEEVTQLLQSIFDSEGWLEDLKCYRYEFSDEIAEDIESLTSDHSFIGQQVGSYTITRQIGEGGMGLVYRAERSEEDFDHCVAIKILRHSHATDSNIQRFKREQQILANLNHSGIAHLFDGGITEDGYPYIIMEYVEGIPITTYCKENHCSTEDKIELFKQVLEAVRHAHENLVIHRDLKPDNILVDDTGKVKILDFGISKLVEEEKETSLSQTSGNILTPKYAAPEQITQSNVTTATDLYSLGVVFYELISGHPLFETKRSSRYEMEQAILHEDPPKPSARVSDSKLRKKLEGDLDAISLKALRKEAEQRYRVANEFLDDLNKYRDGLPVSAGNDSLGYRTQKFLSRHRQGVAVALASLVLIVGLAGYHTRRITAERNQASLEAEKYEHISNFLIGIFEASYPSKSEGIEVTARDLLQQGRKKAEGLNDRALKAEMLSVMGTSYSKLGYRDSALAILEKAKTHVENEFGKNSPLYASILYDIGMAHGNYADLALPYFKKSYRLRTKLSNVNRIERAKSLFQAGSSFIQLNQLDSARHYIKQSEEIVKNNGLSEHQLYLKIKQEKARIYSRSGQQDKARDIYLDLLSQEKRERVDPLTKSTWNQNLAWVFIREKNFARAVPYLRNALDITESVLGKGHQTTLKVRNDLAGVNSDLGNMNRFQELSEENIRHTIDRYGFDHKMTCQATAAYGMQLTLFKLFDNGEKYLRQSLQSCSQSLGENHIWTAVSKALLAANMEFNGKARSAEPFFQEGYTVLKNKSATFNRINRRQVSLILRLYREVDSTNTQKIRAYSALISDSPS